MRVLRLLSLLVGLSTSRKLKVNFYNYKFFPTKTKVHGSNYKSKQEQTTIVLII